MSGKIWGILAVSELAAYFIASEITSMNRPKQYDREELLETITSLFWEKGFDSTSMNEVVARTNVNKFSIYNEFGDKERLFLACIDYYTCNSCNFAIKILTKKPLGLSNIKEFFEHKIRYAAIHKKVCLIFNSFSEQNILNEETNLRINTFVSNLRTLFYNCLKAAQKKEINNKKDCRELANYLSCFVFGLVSVGMREASEEELQRMSDMALLAIYN